MAAQSRRMLRFESLDAMLEDARQVVSHPHVTVGNWTAGQILDHLAKATNSAFDGFGFQAPVWLRWLVKPFRNRFLVKPMGSGFRLPKRAVSLMPPGDVSEADALTRFEQSVERLKSQNPSHPHPVLGPLTPEEYRLLALRHSELHLSFIVPAE